MPTFLPSHLLTFFRQAGAKRLLTGILALSLLLRLALLLFFWDQPLTIVDEQHYQAIAENIMNHGEFSLNTGRPTAIRPPLYPFFLAGLYSLTGGVNLNAVRIAQIILSAGIIWMTFLLGKRMFDEKTGLLAAFIMAIYPSFLFFTHFLLTEVLFTFLLLLFVYFFLSMIGFGPRPHSRFPAFQPSLSSCGPSHVPTLSPSLDPTPSSSAPSDVPTFPPSALNTTLSPSLDPTPSSSAPSDVPTFPPSALNTMFPRSLDPTPSSLAPSDVPTFSPSAVNTTFSRSLDSVAPSHPPTFSPSSYALLSGLSLGLGALTRSILYPFLPIAALFLFFFLKGSLPRKLGNTLLLVLGFAVIVGPWTFRNFTLFHAFVPVETMGGLNLYMGNYEHTPLNRAWAAVDLTGDRTWYYGHEDELKNLNEVEKERWAKEKAKNFIMNNKLLTFKRLVIKAANFWGLERTVIGGIIAGHWPGLRLIHFLIGLTIFIFVGYVLVVINGVFGISMTIGMSRPGILIMALLALFFTCLHGVVFGHPRYHLPLIPLLGIPTSYCLLHLRVLLVNCLRTFRINVAILVGGVFVVIWIREVIFVEGGRYVGGM